MAKFDSYLLGKVSKTLGNVTMCYMNKQNIARARIFSRKDKPTSEMLDQRARMKVLIELSRFLLPVVQKGFVGIGNGTTSNAFVAKNMKAVDVDEKHVATVDYERLKMATGVQDFRKSRSRIPRRIKCILSNRRCRRRRTGSLWLTIWCMLWCSRAC